MAQLQMFRAQWMFELAPGVSSSNLESRHCRTAKGSLLKAAADTKGKQELAKEEKPFAYLLRFLFSIEDDDDESKTADLLSCFQQELTFQESVRKLCQPELESSQTHISVLPMEVLMYIFRWVVSSDLDLRSLEQLSLVCRGFYICARYIRFFPDGHVMMLTTPEEPQSIVPRLRTRNTRSTGETAVSAFEIDKMYTPLFFARVRSYTAFSERPL
ncbi:F-box only protein 9 [Tupaia chinensis]|uniref:F-box only protein n=1 Tax=Tupaia chinensis TaxID=246437 RepID=L8YAH9_TUPCH|nr:F-box only protein 9 [Tupaia chinensis]